MRKSYLTATSYTHEGTPRGGKIRAGTVSPSEEPVNSTVPLDDRPRASGREPRFVAMAERKTGWLAERGGGCEELGARNKDSFQDALFVRPRDTSRPVL